MPKNVKDATPPALRPYRSHGLGLDPGGGDWAHCDCPFCGRDGKFGVQYAGRGEEVGRYKCLVCDAAGGDARQFLRAFHAASFDQTPEADYSDLASSRRLLSPETLIAWRAAKSLVTGEWLLPGYGPGGDVETLYRYAKPADGGKPVLLPTAGLSHSLFMAEPAADQGKPAAYVAEGPWDAMALWEVLRLCRRDGDLLKLTGGGAGTLADGVAVVATAGANVYDPRFNPVFRGRDVTLFPDSDHPKRRCRPCAVTYSAVTHSTCPGCGEELDSKVIVPAGWAGARRTASLLLGGRTAPRSLAVMRWGDDGYDPVKASGTDVRDALSAGVSSRDRVANLGWLLSQVGPLPEDVRARRPEAAGPRPCSRWGDLLAEWRRAMRWRQDLEDVLAVLLAVVTSTSQTGDQLFLQLVADPGSGKTRFCDALLTSPHCFSLEHVTGFHSGWKDETGQDFSLIARINHKTLITPEGDVMFSSPVFGEIMAQQRRIFDGSSGATYKNRKDDLRYTGLRTPWVIAMTPRCLEHEQAGLGDRFLKVFIGRPDEAERAEIMRRVGGSAFDAVLNTSNGDGDGAVNEDFRAAYALTGGYVEHLRANAERLLAAAARGTDREALITAAGDYAEFAAAFRARPPVMKHKEPEAEDAAELPSRLQAQFVRLALCLAAATGRPGVDADVLRVVRKVAADTCRGRTQRLGRLLAEAGTRGETAPALALLSHEGEAKLRDLLNFLRKVGVVERYDEPAGKSRVRRWRLTAHVARLWDVVVKDVPF